MADLPPERVEVSAAFDHVGIDCFGPFYIKTGKKTRRTHDADKQFVLLVNCMSSRAVHLEPLDGMDTSSFINAFRRFCAIRGPCKTLLSDHGSNFMGALGQVDEFKRFKEEVQGRGIEWRMNPVGASHYGGSYERKIGSVRRVLEAFLLPHRVPVSRDEFHTLLQEAAAVVNSTPLYPSPEGSAEPLPISPSMLLTLKTPQPTNPPDTFDEKDMYAQGLRRWRRVQFLADSFWRRWRDHFIQEKVRRNKWTKRRPSLKPEDVVMVREKTSARCDWKTGVIRRIIPSSDGLIRRAVVAVAGPKGTKEIERAISDLVLLFTP